MKKLVILMCLFECVASLTENEVSFVILTQSNEHHLEKARNLGESIVKQANTKESLNIQLVHQDNSPVGYWTIFPLIQKLKDKDAKWFVFCEDVTKINLKLLLNLLSQYSSQEDWFLGHALRDKFSTIIHHFAHHEDPGKFSYPSMAAGFALSRYLLLRFADVLHPNFNLNSFSIDPKHEIATFLKGQLDVEMTHSAKFCAQVDAKDENCATSVNETFPNCQNDITDDDYIVAVKTYSEFYNSRLQVVAETFALYVKHIKYFGDIVHLSPPVFPLKVPNTKSGHCEKTITIMKHILEHSSSHKWLVIVDDDTILSVSKLKKLLGCYDSNSKIAIGERYGFDTSNGNGYDYITGGGGMVFSMPTIRALLEENDCTCPGINSPDDMILGICLKNLEIPILNSPHFHQARPSDYSPIYLESKEPVSFHKHWLIDPIETYKEWFYGEDKNLTVFQNYNLHTEL